MNMRLGITISVAVLAAVGPPVQAQRGFGGARGFGGGLGVHSPSRGGGGFRARGPFRGGGRGHFVRPRMGGRYFQRSNYVAVPYLYSPYFYADYYPSEPPVTDVSPPQVIVVNTPEPAVTEPPPPPAEPLVLELRGDHWVRITDSGESDVGAGSVQQGASPRPAVSEAPAPGRAVPPAVLVFRDGHQEQTGKYAIIGSVIYSSTNYWVGGAWTRKIPIAELDVPATLRANQERGVKFNLPSAPNEVVIRP
jgi:hypothetical protein